MIYLHALTLFGEGLLTGLLLTMMLGPVTMMILRWGIQSNRMAGLWAAAGTWISDFAFIGVTYSLTASVERWSKDSRNQFWIYLVGGLGLIIIGFVLMRVRREILRDELKSKKSKYANAFASGFLVNSLSPFTLFFWVGAAVFVRIQSANAFYYYAGLMATLAAGDFTKAWLAPKLGSWLNAKYVYWVQVIAGAVIVLTGAYIIFKGVTNE